MHPVETVSGDPTWPLIIFLGILLIGIVASVGYLTIDWIVSRIKARRPTVKSLR